MGILHKFIIQKKRKITDRTISRWLHVLKEELFKTPHFLFFRDVKAGSVMAPSILWRTSRMQHCTHFQSYLTVSHSQQISGKFYMSSEGTAVELAVKHTVSNSIKVSDLCIISIESGLPKVGVQWLPSPAVRRVHRKAICLRLLLVHRFCQHQSQEPLFQQKRTLWCSHQSNHCHCQNCCPHHLQQQNHTH